MPNFDYAHQYSQFHDATDEHTSAKVREHGLVLEPLLRGRPRGMALDVGCGRGYVLQSLKHLGFDAEGLEEDESQVAAARTAGHTVTESGDLVKFTEGRAGSFVLVTMIDVLEHIPVFKQIEVLRAARILLSANGALIIQTPNALSPLAAYFRYIDWTHTSAFTTTSLRSILLSADFTDIRFMRNPPPRSIWKRPPLRRWRKILVRAAWRFVIRAELGNSARVRAMPTDLNLLVVAQ